LSHGASLGPYDWLDKYGLTRVPGAVVQDIHGDQIIQMIPWTQLAWIQVHQGHLPLWNPYSALGMPLAFNWQSATFSLPSLVGYLMPLRLAFTAQVLVTLVVAGTGAYALARVLKLDVLAAAFAGTVFELSGAFVFWLGWPIGSVLSWTGWLFVAVLLVLRGGRRVRHVTLLAVVMAAAIYAGQPDPLVVLVLSVFVFAIALLVQRAPLLGGSGPILKPAVDLVLGVGAGFALAAPLALPGYQIAGNAIRIVEGSTFGRQVAFPLQSLGYLVFSGLNGAGPNLNPTYLGVIVVVLAVSGLCLQRRRPEVVALVAVTVVMGAVAFLQPVENVLHALPGVQAVRWYRSAVPMMLAIAGLSAVGMHLLVGAFRDRLVRRWLGVEFSIAAVVLLLIGIVGARGLTSGSESARNTGIAWAAVETAVGLAGVGVLALVSRRRVARDRRGPVVSKMVGMVFLVCVTAFLVAQGAPLWHSTSSYGAATPGEAALQKAVGTSLVGLGSVRCFLVPGLGIHPNVNILYDVDELAVYDPMLPRGYYQSWAEVTRQRPNSAGVARISSYCPAITSASIARVYGVSFVLEAHGRPGPRGGVFVERIGHEDLYRIPGASAATLTPTPSDGEFPPLRASGTAVPVSHPNPASWKLETNSASAQTLRLRLTNVPGWHASIDGKPLELESYAGIMLQAHVPPGRHVIELNYWPSTFSAGIVLAFVAAVILLLALITEARRHRR